MGRASTYKQPVALKTGFGPIPMFIFVLLFKSSNQYEENCNLRLDELCQTWRQAAACNTTPYCIHCVWNTAIIPKESVDKCQVCNADISKGMEHQYNMFPLLERTCGLHGDEMDAIKCRDMLQGLTTGIVDDIVHGKFNSSQLCSILALCRSFFEVTVTNAEEMGEEIPTTSESTEPIAMAKGGLAGGARGGAFGGKGSFARGSTSSSKSGSFSGKAGGRSIAAGRARGIVTPMGHSSQYHTGGGRFIPVFIGGGGGRGSRHSCRLQEQEEDWDGWEYLGLGIMILIIVGLFLTCARAAQKTPRSN